MTKVFDVWAEERTQQFRRAVSRFRSMALEVDELAAILDDSAEHCSGCGARSYLNFEQRNLRMKVTGVSERLRIVADDLDNKARDPNFIGDPKAPKVREAPAPVVDEVPF